MARETEGCCYTQVIIQSDKFFLSAKGGTWALPPPQLQNPSPCPVRCQPENYHGFSAVVLSPLENRGRPPTFPDVSINKLARVQEAQRGFSKSPPRLKSEHKGFKETCWQQRWMWRGSCIFNHLCSSRWWIAPSPAIARQAVPQSSRKHLPAFQPSAFPYQDQHFYHCCSSGLSHFHQTTGPVKPQIFQLGVKKNLCYPAFCC